MCGSTISFLIGENHGSTILPTSPLPDRTRFPSQAAATGGICPLHHAPDVDVRDQAGRADEQRWGLSTKIDNEL